MNAQVPIDRLKEFEGNGIIGQLNSVFWSLCGFIPNAARFASTRLPELVERVSRYEVQAVLLVPASRLCHQTLSITARGIESAGIPTMMLAVDRATSSSVRARRAPPTTRASSAASSGSPTGPSTSAASSTKPSASSSPSTSPAYATSSSPPQTEVEMARGER